MEKKEHILFEVSDSEVLFLDYLVVAHYYSIGMKLVSKVEYSRFKRRINQLEEEVEQLFVFLGEN